MHNFRVLLVGEYQRLKKYNLLYASLLIAIIWIVTLQFLDVKNISYYFPLFIFLDATSMSILMIGVSMFFEKQEGVLKSMFVSPVSKLEFIFAKTVSNISLNILTLVILYVYAYFFKDIVLNIALLCIYVILVSFFHSMIGFILTFYAKDFTDVLMGMLKYSFILIIPVILVELDLINIKFIENILYLIPTQAALLLFNSTVAEISIIKIVFSLLYLITGSIVLYYITSKKFDNFIIRESGV